MADDFGVLDMIENGIIDCIKKGAIDDLEILVKQGEIEKRIENLP